MILTSHNKKIEALKLDNLALRKTIKILEDKLEIAVEALEKIVENDYGNSYEQSAEAIEALEKIKNV